LMTRAGLEPATKGLRVPCSAKLSLHFGMECRIELASQASPL
jgi:hypothetical protein